MNKPARAKTKKILSLSEAAKKLGVSEEILLNWNEHNILKPTITRSGNVGYSENQLEKFIAAKEAFLPPHLSHPHLLPLSQQKK